MINPTTISPIPAHGRKGRALILVECPLVTFREIRHPLTTHPVRPHANLGAIKQAYKSAPPNTSCQLIGRWETTQQCAYLAGHPVRRPKDTVFLLPGQEPGLGPLALCDEEGA